MQHLIGKRVQIPVHTDAWMRGDRYGEIVRTQPTDRVVVKLDISKRVISCHVDSIVSFVD